MIVERLHDMTLAIEVCTDDPSRYEWSVRRHGRIVRRAPWSAPDQSLALKQGRVALQEADALWQDSHQRRTDRVPDTAAEHRHGPTQAAGAEALVLPKPRGSGRPRSKR